MLSREVFSSWAQELGFDQVGFCRTDVFDHSQRIVESQAPLDERKQLRFNPEEDLPEAKSIAVLLYPYLPAQQSKEGEVFVDSYYAASNAAYHAARALEEKVLASGCFAKANVAYPAKEAAVRAGLGIIGHNSLLITPTHGSRVVIILMATAIEADIDACAHTIHRCIGCGKCAEACPGGAIDEKGLTHPQRCLRNFIMEGIVVPQEARGAIGTRLIGCDLCQRVCPMQPSMAFASDSVFFLHEFLTEDPSVFSASASRLAQQIGRNAARPQRIRAQAALIAGNTKDPSCLPVLRSWSQLPFDAVRQHALWAIEQIESETTDT